ANEKRPTLPPAKGLGQRPAPWPDLTLPGSVALVIRRPHRLRRRVPLDARISDPAGHQRRPLHPSPPLLEPPSRFGTSRTGCGSSRAGRSLTGSSGAPISGPQSKFGSSHFPSASPTHGLNGEARRGSPTAESFTSSTRSSKSFRASHPSPDPPADPENGTRV